MNITLTVRFVNNFLLHIEFQSIAARKVILCVCIHDQHLYFQEFTDETIARLVKTLELPETYALALMALSSIAPANKQAFLQHDDAILACMRRTPSMSHQGSQILLLLCSYGQVTL